MSRPIKRLGDEATYRDSGNADPTSSRLGTSFASAAGSSVLSNGSLLDLYSRSPSSTANSAGASTSYGVSPGVVSAVNSTREQGLGASSTSANPGKPPPLPARPAEQATRSTGFDVGASAPRAAFAPPSPSDWTAAAPTRDAEPVVGSKRASVAGFDAEMLKNVRPAYNAAQGGDASAWRAYSGGALSHDRDVRYDEGDSDSEGSHYDDDDAVGEDSRRPRADLGPTRSGDSDYARPTLSLTEPDASTAGDSRRPSESSFLHLGGSRRDTSMGSSLDASRDSGLASPPVPQRTSSFNRDEELVTPSLGTATAGTNTTTSPQAGLPTNSWASPLLDDADRAASRAASRRPSLALHSSQIPLRRSSSEIRRSSDHRRHGRASTENTELRDGLGITSSLQSSPEKRGTGGANSHDSASARGSLRAGEELQLHPSQDSSAKPPIRGEALQVVTEDPSKSPRIVKRDGSPTPARRDAATRPDSRDSDMNAEEQARLERELLAGDSGDGSRPRTLKEARERARLRRQQSEAAAGPSTSSPLRESAPTEARPSSKRTGTRQEEALPRKSTDSVDRPSRDPRRLSAKEAVPLSRTSTRSDFSAPSDYSHGSEPDLDGQFQDAANAGSRTSYEDAVSGEPLLGGDDFASAASQGSGGMEELTAAVSSAMQDLSFGSADDSSNTIYGAAGQGELDRAAALDAARTDQDLQTPRPPVSSRFDDGRLRTVSGAGFGTATGRATVGDSDLELASPYGEKQLPDAAASRSLQSAVREEARAPDPWPITRIEIYGKTVPFPKSFASTTVTGRRKAAAWERAKLYAQFTNDLLTLQTGLERWMDAVQRPAMRQQLGRQSQDTSAVADEHDARRGHPRNEGSYAASVRSDLTFPMRGDGGKAKEIVSLLPTMPESPPSRVPANLPYPSLVDQRSNSTSSGNFSTSSISQPISLHHEVAATQGTGKAGGMTSSTSSGGNSRSVAGGSFFSSLGRKGSRRAPGGSVSSLAQGGLASIAGAVGGPRGHKTKGKTISAPIQATGERRSMDTAELSSPDLGSYGRASGLGESASASRLATVSEQQLSAGTLASPTGSRPSPMGPRAPGSVSGQGFFSSIGRSNSNDAGRASANPSARPSHDGSSIGGSSPMVSSPEFEQRGWNEPTQRPKNGRSGSSASLLGSRDSAMSAVRSSFSYGTVREKMRGMAPSSPDPSAANDPGFQEALSKLADVLPDADSDTLAYYLRKAKGNDLVAIGDYLQDQSLGRLPG
ncbi:uncharacterized protein PFL1_03629 [Pseudozyma flocculosa PF-1]|uniref:CUE domain-containing protein n=2 Tax=Pseudozyma flocculosa TaxID=84751 RepID=A0A5C3F4F0_9BASI|nr:uncharacterized protein PFL1_03629 [Pseudozyma flocculosa PF-1]EPQ28826.1 hypothetical protein PFL1_03629 [Pseudozyma flocculosa PF-1]SPO39384.1 uncharacterized protein PSFLO_04865 [Pseudozyma flocculosa]